MISFVEEDVKLVLKNRRVIKQWINSTIDSFGFKTGDICYIFCSDDYILSINNQYLNHDYFTDIITFDYVEDGVISGDLFISLDTVRSNSELFKTSYLSELHRVIIHGILHLCGLKDKSPDEEIAMRNAENLALEKLNSLLEKQ